MLRRKILTTIAALGFAAVPAVTAWPHAGNYAGDMRLIRAWT